MDLEEKDYEVLTSCPWCKKTQFKNLYVDYLKCNIVQCECGCVYAKKRINDRGRKKFWKNYLSRDHEADKRKTQQRHEMYKIEKQFICDFIDRNIGGNLLDVGCGKGDFMELFKAEGFCVTGVEYGREAYEEAIKKKRNVIFGEFPALEFQNKFDLIIFRGTIQYFPNPREYFRKAFSLLEEGGMIYLYYVDTSSICFELFGEKFSVPVTGVDYIGYNEFMLTGYFKKNNMVKVAERDYYLGTPYEDYKNDIRRIARAIDMKECGGTITDKCPPFFGNIKGTLYQKRKTVI